MIGIYRSMMLLALGTIVLSPTLVTSFLDEGHNIDSKTNRIEQMHRFWFKNNQMKSTFCAKNVFNYTFY